MHNSKEKYILKEKFPFLTKGGEMATLIRKKDWSQNEIGLIETWPQSLRSTLGIVLHSRFPMFLWWGPKLICFYNDAYRPSLGEDGKHPGILGMAAKDAWPEIWDIIKPQIDQALNGEGATWNEEMLVPIFRNGKIEDVYWTYSYSPVNNEKGKIEGVLVTCMEETKSVDLKRSLAESEKKFKNLVMNSPIGVTILRGPDLKIELANEMILKKIWRKEKEKVIGKNLLNVFPELMDQKFPKLLKQVLISGRLVKEFEFPMILKNDNRNNKFYLDFELDPLFENDGSISGIIVSANDVTEKIKANDEVSSTEEMLRLAVEASEMAIWEIDLKADKINYNKKLLDIFGRNESEELTLDEIRSQIYPSDRHGIVKEAFAVALKTGNYKFETRLVKPDGSIVRVRTIGKVFHDEKGEPSKIIGTLRNITHEEINQQALERSERRLRNLILNAPVSIGILNGPDYVVEIINESALKLMGKTRDQMLNKPVLEVMTEVDIEKAKFLLDNVYYTGKSFSASEFPVKLQRNGKLEKVYVNFEYDPLINGQGKVYGILVVGTEVTEQVLTRHKVEESEARFRLLADSMPQFVWSANNEGIIKYFNQAVFDYSGLSNEQLQNGDWIEIIHPDERKKNIIKWMESIQTGKDFIFEHRFKRYDGTYRWQLSRAIALRDEKDKIHQWIGTSTDINDIKVQEQQKDFFISMASHELKTPITSIKGYVQILQSIHEKSGDELLIKSLDRIHVQIEKLTRLITDMLDVSKIRNGGLAFHKQSFELNNLIKEVIEGLEIIHPEYKLVFKNDFDLPVYADRERIGQVLINLVTNAIKYSPKNGNIIITSELNQNEIVVSVNDEGIGIDKNYQKKIFERFYRVEGKSEKTFPGFGIGLFITSEIIKRHKGKIWVESEPGKGSQFYFTLPSHKK
ncbi:MAG TPA: PAS domain S-box protein [Hanamia sp.]|nr:PAS domain S-box protein [Hanamia sp.]